MKLNKTAVSGIALMWLMVFSGFTAPAAHALSFEEIVGTFAKKTTTKVLTKSVLAKGIKSFEGKFKSPSARKLPSFRTVSRLVSLGVALASSNPLQSLVQAGISGAVGTFGVSCGPVTIICTVAFGTATEMALSSFLGKILGKGGSTGTTVGSTGSVVGSTGSVVGSTGAVVGSTGAAVGFTGVAVVAAGAAAIGVVAAVVSSGSTSDDNPTPPETTPITDDVFCEVVFDFHTTQLVKDGTVYNTYGLLSYQDFASCIGPSVESENHELDDACSDKYVQGYTEFLKSCSYVDLTCSDTDLEYYELCNQTMGGDSPTPPETTPGATPPGGGEMPAGLIQL